jgi:ribosomal protein L30E
VISCLVIWRFQITESRNREITKLARLANIPIYLHNDAKTKDPQRRC